MMGRKLWTAFCKLASSALTPVVYWLSVSVFICSVLYPTFALELEPTVENARALHKVQNADYHFQVAFLDFAGLIPPSTIPNKSLSPQITADICSTLEERVASYKKATEDLAAIAENLMNIIRGVGNPEPIRLGDKHITSIEEKSKKVLLVFGGFNPMDRYFYPLSVAYLLANIRKNPEIELQRARVFVLIMRAQLKQLTEQLELLKYAWEEL